MKLWDSGHYIQNILINKDSSRFGAKALLAQNVLKGRTKVMAAIPIYRFQTHSNTLGCISDYLPHVIIGGGKPARLLF